MLFVVACLLQLGLQLARSFLAIQFQCCHCTSDLKLQLSGNYSSVCLNARLKATCSRADWSGQPASDQVGPKLCCYSTTILKYQLSSVDLVTDLQNLLYSLVAASDTGEPGSRSDIRPVGQGGICQEGNGGGGAWAGWLGEGCGFDC